MARASAVVAGILGALLLLAAAWFTNSENLREQEREELILDLQAQRISRHVNAWKPQYEPYLMRFLNSERSQMRVLLYDLSGREVGRPKGTQPLIPLNEAAARLAPVVLLRPLHQETPLQPHERAPTNLLSHARTGNRLFASNVVGAAWISRMKSSKDEFWLVATTPIADFDQSTGWSFVSAWLQAAIPLSELTRPAHDRWMRLSVLSLAATVLFGALVWAASRQGRALQAAAVVAEQMPLDRVATQRLPEPPHDKDAQRLVRACNLLLEKVGEAHTAQQRLVADAAHELRTPLTILRGEIQVALREPSNNPFLVETLRSNLEEGVRLSRLVDSLLTLARADAGQTLVSCAPLEAESMIRSSFTHLKRLAAERRLELKLESDGAGSHRIQADAAAFERIMRNLLENAIKHSPENSTVLVKVRSDGAALELSVQDFGIGIPEEHLPRIFDRFYRVDAARRRVEGGAGLGLAIVKTLVEAQHGKVSVRSEIGGGTTFLLRFPLLIA